MSTPPPISIGSQEYNPYSSGWYLFPFEVEKIPYGVAGSELSNDQIDVLNAHTIQGLIELVYVRIGNDYLFQGLDGLDDALETTTNALRVLSIIQDLHNALKTSSLGSFSAWFNFDDKYKGEDNYQSNYNSVASAFFGVPIVPDFIFSSAGASIDTGQDYDAFASQLALARNDLSVQVNALSVLADGTADLNDQNSLYNTTKNVLNDMPTPNVHLPGPGIAWSDAKLWAMDFYGANNGQDYAQVRGTQVIITYDNNIDVWSKTSVSPGRQLGMGTGFLQVGGSYLQLGGFVNSIRIVSHNALMPGVAEVYGNNKKGTLVLTFSGRLAIGFTKDHSTMIMINPINDDGEVANPILGSLQGGELYVEGPYIGTFKGASRGQAQNAGLFEQNITLAMTAAQGLNNTQTEQVRAFLFTFEEYYKSASSLLSSMTQLIQKFAQGVRPA